MEIKHLMGRIAGHAGSLAMAAQADARLTCVKHPLSFWPRISQWKRVVRCRVRQRRESNHHART
jgi:hypothetical protein